MPKFSAICLTYARPERLNEAVQCFLDQDYDGDRELVIFNSFLEQTYTGDFPNVQIINCENRPASLGAARNLAIAMSTGDIILTWDDDDLYLPWHIRNYAENWEDEDDWLWISSHFHSTGNKIRSLSPSSLNSFAFRKSLWERVGCYDPMNFGEDRNFVGKATAKGKGRKIDIHPSKVSFVWCYGNNVRHVSDFGPERKAGPSALDRMSDHAQVLRKRGLLRVGKLQIQPRLGRDLQAEAAPFVARHSAYKGKRVCLVQLGRYGDIINMLPIAKMIYERYDKPVIMVSREFEDLLEGISYVIPHAVDIPYHQPHQAINLARQNYRSVVVTQIWGKDGYKVQRQLPSFTMDQWRVAGFWQLWGDTTIRPEFDRRDKKRENDLIAKYAGGTKPVILVNFYSAKSAPWKQGRDMHDYVCGKIAQRFQIVNLAELKAYRFYDLLGLMEKAVLLVSIDTGHVHLAHAVNLPTVFFVPKLRAGWGSAIPRGRIMHTFDYDEAWNKRDEVVLKINEALSDAGVIYRGPAKSRTSTTIRDRKIIHAVERHKNRRAELARLALAWESWDRLYSTGEVIAAHYWDYKRTSMDIGDIRDLPYFKDVIENAMKMASPDDIIMFTNDDTILHPDIAQQLKFQCGIYGVCCSFRRDFQPNNPPSLDATIEEWKATGIEHRGRDMIAFTKAWLDKNLSSIPDVIIGASEFDWLLAFIIRKYHGRALSMNELYLKGVWPCEIPIGFVGHIYHKPKWQDPKIINSAPSQQHNRMLFIEWCRTNNVDIKFNPNNSVDVSEAAQHLPPEKRPKWLRRTN